MHLLRPILLAASVALFAAPAAAQFLECAESDLFVDAPAELLLAQDDGGLDALVGVWCADIEFEQDDFPYRGELRIWRGAGGELRAELEVVYVIREIESRVLQDIAVFQRGEEIRLEGVRIFPLVRGANYVEDVFDCRLSGSLLDCAAADVAGDVGRALFDRVSTDGRPGAASRGGASSGERGPGLGAPGDGGGSGGGSRPSGRGGQPI